MKRRICLLAAAIAAWLAAGCGDDAGGSGDAGGGDDASMGTDAGTDASTSPDGGVPSSGTAWFFGADPGSNAWAIDVVDPTDPDLVVESLEVDDLAVLSGPGGNDRGPSWGDAVPSTDERRIFANAQSVAKVAVFDVETRTFEALVDVGERPTHMYNPNHGTEIWTHADGEGAFYVIDQTSLAVSEPVVAALEDTGHGKLVYAEELGTDYYATNTNDPGVFPIDGAERTVGELIEVCGEPCEENPDERCGGTHDGKFNPAMGYAVFECSGAASGTYGFVDTSDDTVVEDLVPLSGALATSPGNQYILVIDTGADEDQVQIWDTTAEDHDGIAIDRTVTVGGEPSARGTAFRQNDDGDWEAWIPQTAGTKVAVVNLADGSVEEVEVGGVTPPEGGGHFSRRGAIGGDWFFTFDDDGVVVVDLDSKEVTQGGALGGTPSRIAFVDPAGSG